MFIVFFIFGLAFMGKAFLWIAGIMLGISILGKMFK